MKTTADSIAIPDHVTLKTGQGGLPYLELHYNGAEAHVYLHGGHVLHYQPAGQAPVLWQSEKSFFEPGKPIRGGIPICWPWFGPNPNDPQKPAHGFARLVEWKPIHSSATDTETLVVLQLPEECCAEALLQITVKLSQQLSVVLTTTNRQNSPFSFAEALHTYFAIGDIHSASVSGLDGQQVSYRLASDKSPQTQRGDVSFTGETELLYVQSSVPCTLIDPVLKRTITIAKENSLSTVVWNPWIEKSIRMPDFGDEEYLKMVCIETANCGPDSISLAPGQIQSTRLQISVKSFC